MRSNVSVVPVGLTALLAAWLGLVWTAPAHAYIDAGSGMLVLQMIGAVLTGGLIVFRKSVGHLFRRLLGRPIPEEEEEPTEEVKSSNEP